MEAALETGVSKVAHVSSVVTFGKPAELPFNEETPAGPMRFSEYPEPSTKATSPSGSCTKTETCLY